MTWLNSEEGMYEGVIAAGKALGLTPSIDDTGELIKQKAAEALE